MAKKPKGPVVIELDSKAKVTPAKAPPPPDPGPPLPEPRAMQHVATIAARPRSLVVRIFWAALLALIGAMVSLAAWNYVSELLVKWPIMGWIVTGLVGLVLLTLLIITLRELAGFARLRKIDRLQRNAEEAVAHDDLGQARAVVRDLRRLYRNRDELRWGEATLKEQADDQFDAATLLKQAEGMMDPLDKAALQEVETAARQVATVTALVPLALADVLAALTANVRMIRRVAEVYGGRSGTLGSWRLTRAVMAHLVATGAMAVGDDMLEPIIGGGLLGKISRRFGEGLVNGALTARVGIAAMEVCRPLPFSERPKVRQVIQRALTGLMSK